MAVKIDQEIFRQIISKDNRHNLDILDKFVHFAVGDRIRDIALCMTEGMADWIYRYIIYPDNEEFKSMPDSPYSGKAIFMAAELKKILGDSFAGEISAEKPLEIPDPDLHSIDLAGWCKLIRFRFLSKEHIGDFFTGENKAQLNSFIKLISDVSGLRNTIAHERAETIKRFSVKANLTAVLDDFIKTAGQSAAAVTECLRGGIDVSRVLDTMLQDAVTFKDMFELSVNYAPMDKNSNDAYPAEYLYGYDRVYLAYPGCRNKDYARFVTGELNPLMLRGMSNLAVDMGTVDYLAELSESRDPSQAAEAKKLYKEFNNSLRDTVSLLRIEPTGEVFLHYADAFLKQLGQSEENICVLTDDEYVCRRIEEMPDNIIAAVVTDPGHVTPYSGRLTAIPESIEKIPEDTGMESVLIPGRQASVYYGDPANNVKYVLGKCIGEGGEGNIYQTDIGRECFKIYHEHKLNRQRQEKILKMISYNALKEDPRICWPVQPVFESSSRHELVGFSMEDVSFTAGSETYPLDDVIISIHNGDRLHWNWDRRALLDLCMNISEIVSVLHSQDILIGDINPKNFLVDREGEVFLIDTDSCQIGTYVCPVGIPEYSSPALWENDCVYADSPRTLNDEYFALARLIYFILFLGESPYLYENSIIDLNTLRDCIMNKKFREKDAPEDDYIWWNLTPEVRDCFLKVFSSEDGMDHPDEYPDDRKWLNSLYRMAGEIGNGRLSNDLKPYDAVMEPGEDWTEKKCTRCGKIFKSAHNKDEDLCPNCRELRIQNTARILRVRCRKCGRTFISNLWELAELNHFRSTEDIVCPDCDDRVKTICEERDREEQIDSFLKKINRFMKKGDQ